MAIKQMTTSTDNNESKGRQRALTTTVNLAMCTAVSIDTCTAVARFLSLFWRHTPTAPALIETYTPGHAYVFSGGTLVHNSVSMRQSILYYFDRRFT